MLGQLAKKLGYRCVYVLVDKIDENALTGVASSSFQFIAPLVSDLQVLELPNFGFKFFLWDMLMDEYRTVARPDRVKYYTLRWEVSQLGEMLSKRLRAHSADRVSSLGAISSSDAREKIDGAVALFSQGSPRKPSPPMLIGNPCGPSCTVSDFSAPGRFCARCSAKSPVSC
ncbi:MAG: hypothetical protein WBE55_23900 [Candidatus Sulfotelmatobacter sp.]